MFLVLNLLRRYFETLILFLLFLLDWAPLLIVQLKTMLQALVPVLVATPLNYIDMTRLEFNFWYVIDARYMRSSLLFSLGIPKIRKLTTDYKWLFIFALRDSDTIQIDTRHWRSILGVVVASSSSRIVIWLTKTLKSDISVTWRSPWLKIELLCVIAPSRISHVELVLGKVALVKVCILAIYTTSVLGSTIKPCYNLVHFCHHGYVSIVK